MVEPRKRSTFQGLGVCADGVVPDSKPPSERVLVVEQVVRVSRGVEAARGRRAERRERRMGRYISFWSVWGCWGREGKLLGVIVL